MTAEPLSCTAPTLRRRLLALVYEAMLVFAVSFAANMLFSVALEQRHALQYRFGLQLWLFAVLAVYFIGFWRYGGQTLAMKTWRIRLVAADGSRPGWRTLGLRYLLGWCWVLPALALDALLPIGGWSRIAMLAAGIAGWALLARLDPQRQFLHDRIAGTKLVRC